MAMLSEKMIEWWVLDEESRADAFLAARGIFIHIVCSGKV
jgi:hypothetical protein